MKLSASCIRCFVDRQEARIANFEDETAKALYMKELCRIVAQAKEEDSVPVLVEQINRVYRQIFGELTDYAQIKRRFNALMLSVEKELAEKIRQSQDSLSTAMLYARAANYIDYGAFSHISQDTLFSLLEEAVQDSLEKKTYDSLQKDLEHAGELVYITDNCGEVVLDKLVMQVIKERYPRLHITALVRGREALNDVTGEDALQVDLYSVADVWDNGCGVAGTPISYISTDARALLEKADLVIAKGQGNFETMNGCGLNIYYSFLCKCEWFQKRFELPQNRGVLIRERDL